MCLDRFPDRVLEYAQTVLAAPSQVTGSLAQLVLLVHIRPTAPQHVVLVWMDSILVVVLLAVLVALLVRIPLIVWPVTLVWTERTLLRLLHPVILVLLDLTLRMACLAIAVLLDHFRVLDQVIVRDALTEHIRVSVLQPVLDVMPVTLHLMV